MKKILLFAFSVTVAQTSFSQSPVSDSLKRHYLNTYEQALRLNDIELVINSLNNALIEMKAPQSMLYKDTLSMFYFSNKSYFPSYYLAQEVYNGDSSNYKALARIGECLQAGADYKKAADAFEKAAPALRSSYYFYQLAVCNYSLKNTSATQVNADRALADTNSNHIPVIFTMPNGNEQQVPVSSAALNLKGVVMMDEKNYNKAKEYLQAALKIYPNFQGAQQNVLTCDSKMKGTKPVLKSKPRG